jgi:hypothetical protein
VVGGWKKLHNEELHNLYSSSNKIRKIESRRMRLMGHVARMGMKEKHINSTGKLEGKIPLGRLRYRWVDNIEFGLGEMR